MCGIAGVFLWQGEPDTQRLKRALQALRHRGPDAQQQINFSGGDGELPGRGQLRSELLKDRRIGPSRIEGKGTKIAGGELLS